MTASGRRLPIVTAWAAVLAMAVPAPATAQTTPSGQVAKSSVGKVGERATKEQAASGIEPLDRIDSRIQNRVQSRIRNRIDRYYDPTANAVSPFKVAEEKTRTAGTPQVR
ncbi:conserved exported hypothetical protein [Sphingomonas sp. EC-HK361]|uniref:hypothetical protein n=1 Tax=Sphingomonas sp. EC-HK361 TaxID=2038397 RepID=UPI001256BD13|nr:hypothetical protein [Sphingomonas sp. EC-HK361]VVS98495.1 conserved exported hypothetical protein [Sphingomonas sp. EC-HK361]